jgi:hypothetical protein
MLGYFPHVESMTPQAHVLMCPSSVRSSPTEAITINSRGSLRRHACEPVERSLPAWARTSQIVKLGVTENPAHPWWGVTLFLLAAAAAFAVDWHGHASRIAFTPPEDFQGRRWAVVQDAAAAVELWNSAGLRGRRVLVATGRWGKPVVPGAPATMPPEPSPAAPAGPPDRGAQVSGALFDATMRGLARELVVVMPSAAFDARISAIGSARETTLGPGWARQPYHGIPRTFVRPSTLPVQDEAVLLLVEPSFFSEGAPPDLTAWLEARGVHFDLALIAAQDPEATPDQETAALALAGRVGAIQVEVGP